MVLMEEKMFSSPSLLIVPHPVIQAIVPAAYVLPVEAKQIGLM